jgi:hypothetical protein
MTRQRILTAAVLLALALLTAGGGVAIFLAQGSNLVTALVTVPVVIAGFLALLRTDTAKIISLFSALQLFLPIAAYGVTYLLMGKTAGTPNFDEIGAQIIIVLLLALAIDARFFRLRVGRDRLDVAGILYVVVVLAVGEYYALRGLLTEPAHAEMIAGAIAAGFTAVAVSALIGAESAEAR